MISWENVYDLMLSEESMIQMLVHYDFNYIIMCIHVYKD